jgi:hypothetical protein
VEKHLGWRGPVASGDRSQERGEGSGGEVRSHQAVTTFPSPVDGEAK